MTSKTYARIHAVGPATQTWLPFHPSGPGATADAPRQDGRPGRLVAGRYRLECLLGKGGMGAVWLATDEFLERSVAVKEFTVPETVMDRSAARARMLAEARAASRVSHPGVVQVHDLVVEHGRHWIVMEALTGRTLEHRIRKGGRLDLARVADIAVQLLDALRALHRAGIVHGDVKPGNVLLNGGSRVVLTDFGLASRDDVGPAAEPGRFFGSPPYMAPEAIDGGSRGGPASDLFSLGATLYAAVEGHQPFHAPTLLSTLDAVKNDPAPPALHAGDLRPLIDGLLTKDPGQRLGWEEARQHLEAFRSGRPRGRWSDERHTSPTR